MTLSAEQACDNAVARAIKKMPDSTHFTGELLEALRFCFREGSIYERLKLDEKEATDPGRWAT